MEYLNKLQSLSLEQINIIILTLVILYLIVKINSMGSKNNVFLSNLQSEIDKLKTESKNETDKFKEEIDESLKKSFDTINDGYKQVKKEQKVFSKNVDNTVSSIEEKLSNINNIQLKTNKEQEKEISKLSRMYKSKKNRVEKLENELKEINSNN